MANFTSQTAILFLLLLSATTFHISMSRNHSRVARCNEKDRGPLLIFKQGIIDPFDTLSTWSTEEDCCAWEGVHCDNMTNRVVELDLPGSFYVEKEDRFESKPLEGEINFSFLELEFLEYVDLSENSFNSTSIPPIHYNVTLASKLYHLDLSYNYDIHMDSLHWLSPLSSLKHLNLSGIDLHKETNWLQEVAMLPLLSDLHLSRCELSYMNPSLKYVNFTSLVTLDLSVNSLNSELPPWLFDLRNLTDLDLSYNQLKGPIPNWIGQLEHLRDLDISNNMLSGSVPSTLGNLSSLVTLFIGSNYFSGEISEATFSKLSNLKYLDLSNSNFSFQFDAEWVPPFQLDTLSLANTGQGPNFPSWIGQLEHLRYLDISNNMLSGSVPSTLGNLSSLVFLYIGSNNFSGEISEATFSKLSNLKDLDLSNSTFSFQFDSEWVPPFQLHTLSLANTVLGPNFPSWIYTQHSLVDLDLSSSRISLVGGGRHKFWSFVEGINSSLVLSNNSMSGDISNVMLKAAVLFLDHNNFTGGLPQISPNSLRVDLSHNSFSGSFPRSWMNLEDLETIDLWSNRLCGEVLVHLSNSKQLQSMNLGQNKFSGTIPINMSQNLEVIILRANQFEGNIPPQLFNHSHLFHIDVAHNKLSGSIPQCAYNMTQMVTSNVHEWLSATIDLFTKGQDYVYDVNPDRRTIDLSANNLTGEVPSELFQLIQVQTLNLSYNDLTGTIPKTIGNMKYLESLDLSNNKLSGEIPQSLALITFLGFLNLSCNNFSGQIPTGTQLQSFNTSSYTGNPELCGDPLKKCFPKEEEKYPENAKSSTWNQDGDPFRESLYLGMGVGFAAGFWGICGSLFLIRKWRHTCFRFFHRVTDKIYVALMVKLNSFLKTKPPAS